MRADEAEKENSTQIAQIRKDKIIYFCRYLLSFCAILLSMTDQELKDLVASLAVSQKETERRFQENDKRRDKDHQKFMAELKQSRKDIEIQLKETQKMVGGIGNSNGDMA